MRPLVLITALIALAVSAPPPQVRADDALVETYLPDPQAAYPFDARRIPVAEALKLYARNLRIGLILPDDVEGEVRDMPKDAMTRLSYLETLTFDYGLTWFFDGSALHISKVGDTETRVFALKEQTARDVMRALMDLEIYQAKFPHRLAARSQAIRITGPKAYVELTANAIESLETAGPTSIEHLRGSVRVDDDLPDVDDEPTPTN